MKIIRKIYDRLTCKSVILKRQNQKFCDLWNVNFIIKWFYFLSGRVERVNDGAERTDVNW